MLREQKQPSDFFIYDKPLQDMGMSSEQKRFSDMRFLNGKNFIHGERSQGDQQAQQRMMQNIMTAHHLDPNAPAGDIPFTEPPIEALVDKVLSGEMPKGKLGEDADRIINEVLDRRSTKPVPTIQVNPENFKLPGEFPGTVEQFDELYSDEREKEFNETGSLEIPVIPFLQSFIESRKG